MMEQIEGVQRLSTLTSRRLVEEQRIVSVPRVVEELGRMSLHICEKQTELNINMSSQYRYRQSSKLRSVQCSGITGIYFFLDLRSF
jgi:hypothetical protein